MTALLELKQKIKGIYGQYEVYLLPLLKFVLALVYFIWINTNMGYMTALDNIFVVLILSLICCILPSGMMIFAGFALMVGHCYALGIEVAAFLLVLILFMMILFLRFSSGKNIVLVFTPLVFAFDIPVLLPIGCGLLSNAVSALPAAGGVIIYYFVRTVRVQSQVLLGMDSDIVGKLTLLSDSLMKNGEMWLTLIAFIAVVLAVNLIRTRMFDYAWRIAIVAGGVIYIVIMLAGSMSLGISISVVSLIIYTVIAVLVGIILEFFVFGGDYTRTTDFSRTWLRSGDWLIVLQFLIKVFLRKSDSFQIHYVINIKRHRQNRDSQFSSLILRNTAVAVCYNRNFSHIASPHVFYFIYSIFLVSLFFIKLSAIYR